MVDLGSMYIALTGTPGTGKTTAAKILASKGFNTITVEELARKHNAIAEIDGDLEIYVEKLASAIEQLLIEGPKYELKQDIVILEGHLAHFLPSQICIILRCHPDIIHKRLEARGYEAKKVKENAEAEAIDLILSEAVEHNKSVFEIDASSLSPEQIAHAIETIMNDGGDIYSPGKVDWSMVVMDWY